MKQIMCAVVIAMLAGAPAMAACPPAATGSDAEAVAANQRRLVCLQQEISTDARMRSLEMDIQMLEMKQDQMQLQRRLDAIPKPPPPPVIPKIVVP